MMTKRNTSSVVEKATNTTGLKFINGAVEGIRTPDPRITNAVLYQLSYDGNGRTIAGGLLSGNG